MNAVAAMGALVWVQPHDQVCHVLEGRTKAGTGHFWPSDRQG